MNEGQLIVDAFRRLAPGERAALATIVSLEGSSYRRPGARMLITQSGETTGVLSAGCFERDVCERAISVMENGEPVLVKYDTTTDDDIVWGLGLGCSGVVHVLIEPATYERVAGVMQLLAETAESDSCGAIATVFRVTGAAEESIGVAALLYPDGTVDGNCIISSIFDDLREAARLGRSTTKRYQTGAGCIDVFLDVLQPRVKLVIFGAGHDVLPVVNLAKNLGWHTTVVDTRARAASVERFQVADEVLLLGPEEAVTRINLSERTIVLVMTHNYLHDLELLQQLLPLPLRYLGCLGPRRRTERLLLECATDLVLANLHAPVGLDIGAETPDEIALSIVCEIKTVLSQRNGMQLRDREGSIHEPQISRIDPDFELSLPVESVVHGLDAVCESVS